GVADSADLFGGSYAVEHLTNQIEAVARQYIQKIDDMGGVLRAIENGWVQREIQEAAYQYQKALEHNEEVVVGVNKFTIEEEGHIPILKINDEIERNQVESLKKLRSERNQQEVDAALAAVTQAAKTDENLMPHIIRAVEVYATVGEISDRLREVFGEYQESITI
ncbi:MAG: methylmalonyl-CoA mutase, partial [Blastocatellia bacterium]|nr:methylmalonyl-CoA mutase [Blastocatellia bacterium]